MLLDGSKAAINKALHFLFDVQLIRTSTLDALREQRQLASDALREQMQLASRPVPDVDVAERILREIGLTVVDRYGVDSRRFNIEAGALLIDSLLSANYARKCMRLAQACDNRQKVLDLAVSKCGLHSGQILEFGVFKGLSIRRLAMHFPDAEIFGFDTFEGLPSDWGVLAKKGYFDLEGNAPEGLPPNVRLIKGLFDDTLPDFMRQHPEPIRLLHIDCDLYESTKSVFALVRKQIVPGTVIIFDEYFNYLGWELGEYKAFQEMVKDMKMEYEYIAYSRFEEQAAVVIKQIG